MESCGQPNRVGTDSRGHPPMGSLPHAVIPPLATKPRGHPPMWSLTCEDMRSPVHMMTHSHRHPPMGSPTLWVSNSHGNPPCTQQLKLVPHPHSHPPMRPLTHGVTCPRSHQAVPSLTQILASAEVRDSDVRQRPKFRQQGLTGVLIHEFLLLQRAGGLDSDPKDVHVLAPCGGHNNVHMDVHILPTS